MKILIIDGNNFAHMGHSSQVLSYNGQRTEVIFFGLNMLSNLLNIHTPDRLFIVWDGGRDPRRLEKFPEYKAHRKKKRETIIEKREREIFFEQMDILKSCFSGFGFIQVEWPDREADDIIYSIIDLSSTIFKDEQVEFVVSSTDKDFFLLFSEFSNVIIYNPVKKIEITKEIFEQEFGFPVTHYLDYKAMIGDTSDNLPGVSGIGEVGARMLVERVFMEVPKESAGEEIPNKDLRFINLLTENMQEFTKMRDLMEFIRVDNGELNLAIKEDFLTNINELHTRVIEVLNKYGFQHTIDRFPLFIQPFELLFKKRAALSIGE